MDELLEDVDGRSDTAVYTSDGLTVVHVFRTSVVLIQLKNAVSDAIIAFTFASRSVPAAGHCHVIPLRMPGILWSAYAIENVNSSRWRWARDLYNGSGNESENARNNVLMKPNNREIRLTLHIVRFQKFGVLVIRHDLMFRN